MKQIRKSHVTPRTRRKRAHRTKSPPPDRQQSKGKLIKDGSDLSDLWAHAPIGIFHSVPEGRYLYVNPAFAEMLGYASPTELISTITNAATQLYVNPIKHSKIITETLSRDSWYKTETQYRHKNGEIITANLSVRQVLNADGNLAYLEGFIENITERKRAEAALLEAEEKYRTLVETADDAIVLTNMDGRPLFRNSAYYTSLGYSPGEEISVDGYSNVHPEDLARVKNLLNELIERGSVAIEYRVRHKDGHWVCRFAKSTVIYDDLHKPNAVLAIIRDVTEQKQAEEARIQLIDQLRLNREELRTLSRRMVEIQEQERREIARELHDEIGQWLTGLKLLLHVTVDMPTEKILANIDQAQKTIAELVARVRDVSLDLRPAILDDLGLLPTLLWYLERYTTQTQVNINFRHIGLEGKRFTSSIETAAFRIIQEALTNIARHAQVKEANVRVWANTDTLLVQIQDMGKGFDAASALASGQSSGLTGMRERAMLLGGTMMIESAPKNGTRLTAEIPLSGWMERRLNDRVHFAGR